MEKVNHPDHYNIPGKKECIVQMQEDFGDYITMIFCLTSAYKYLYRAGHKPGESFEDDINKAKFYYGYCMGIDVSYRNMWLGNDFTLRHKVEELLKNLGKGK